MGAFVEGELPFVHNANFPSPFVFHSSYIFLSCFKELVGGHCHGLVSRYDCVIHKYLMEMRRLAHDETPFPLVMQLKATTLAWRSNDGNVIPLNTYDHDRSVCDETSYPPTNTLSIHYHSFCGSPISYRETFHCFLGDPWVKHLKGFMIRFYLFPATFTLWALSPFFP
jgi:hypothetical protein